MAFSGKSFHRITRSIFLEPEYDLATKKRLDIEASERMNAIGSMFDVVKFFSRPKL